MIVTAIVIVIAEQVIVVSVSIIRTQSRLSQTIMWSFLVSLFCCSEGGMPGEMNLFRSCHVIVASMRLSHNDHCFSTVGAETPGEGNFQKLKCPTRACELQMLFTFSAGLQGNYVAFSAQHLLLCF